VWLDRYIPWVRRHGYLLATVAVKRSTQPSASRGRTRAFPAESA